MKTICLVLTCTLAGAATAGERAWERGAYMEEYLTVVPWESKALTPLSMARQPGRGPVVLCERADPLLPIVIPARNKPGSGYYRQIVEFLKNHLDGATGASFEVVGDDSAPSRGIFVGPCDGADLVPFIERARAPDPEHILVSAFTTPSGSMWPSTPGNRIRSALRPRGNHATVLSGVTIRSRSFFAPSNPE